jgi:hypothetical protein
MPESPFGVPKSAGAKAEDDASEEAALGPLVEEKLLLADELEKAAEVAGSAASKDPDNKDLAQAAFEARKMANEAKAEADAAKAKATKAMKSRNEPPSAPLTITSQIPVESGMAGTKKMDENLLLRFSALEKAEADADARAERVALEVGGVKPSMNSSMSGRTKDGWVTVASDSDFDSSQTDGSHGKFVQSHFRAKGRKRSEGQGTLSASNEKYTVKPAIEGEERKDGKKALNEGFVVSTTYAKTHHNSLRREKR